jgi:SAM-dependent methyltransferase
VRLPVWPGVELEFVQGDMTTELSSFGASVFDLVLSVCALMYISDLDNVFLEVTRVLRGGGRFIFSVDHPIMASVGATELWPEEGSDPGYDYRGLVQWKWFSDDDFMFTSYRRPVSDYVNALANAGLHVQRMLELYPKGQPGWDSPERELRQRFPSVLVLVSRKP